METNGKPQEKNDFTTKEEEVEEECPVEYFCGIGSFRPKFLQVFRDAKFFTFLISLYCLLEGALATGKTLYNRPLLCLDLAYDKFLGLVYS